jgi:hypothetical protein
MDFTSIETNSGNHFQKQNKPKTLGTPGYAHPDPLTSGPYGQPDPTH